MAGGQEAAFSAGAISCSALVAAAFAEAGEPLLCLCAVQKVQDGKKRGERLLGVGTHRLLVLSPKRCARWRAPLCLLTARPLACVPDRRASAAGASL